MPATLEFWFDFASTYSYLAAQRIEAAAAARGVTVAWRPFLLGPIFAEQGLQDSPFNVNLPRGRYMWRDLERQSARYGLPWRRPSAFPRNSVAAARIATAALGEPWLPGFVRAVFHANFALDRDIAQREVLADLLGPHQAFLDARGPVREATEEARRRGLFGAPSFLVGDELYFGDDRLDDAIAFAAGVR